MPTDDAYADLADLILNVARLIRLRTPDGPEVVSLTPTERQVMRIVDLHPGVAPSEVAERTRLQRSNVSTALSSLDAKRMITRQAQGREVAIHATDFAGENLRTLRGAWTDVMREAATGHTASIKEANVLLAALEERLSAPR